MITGKKIDFLTKLKGLASKFGISAANETAGAGEQMGQLIDSLAAKAALTPATTGAATTIIDGLKAETARLNEVIKAKDIEIATLSERLANMGNTVAKESARAVAQVMSQLAIPAIKDNGQIGDEQNPTGELRGYARLVESARRQLEKIKPLSGGQ